ncbi:MAG: hypothetical protein K5986_11695 [Clostridium sp.]|uniref:hypothetical protein n=1 Tax=Clostridium sp. DSM 8431 TaxID=1761781 RepID=UPI0008F17840|nr:hypothetical protein [Clostridium sp. DSM 8431]MBQ6630607.1 hypothetical protein [Romboutsia sp.]MCR4945073.1 hypothetical protein [Clostridium sp.]SFU68097.1 hypothetical protein SAMN04487886_11001 [Clostridium sp. DSM 8431]
MNLESFRRQHKDVYRAMDEMGCILKEFTEYKEKYNTKTKILADINKTVIETTAI